MHSSNTTVFLSLICVLMAIACKRCKRHRPVTGQHQESGDQLNKHFDTSTSHSFDGTEVVAMKQEMDTDSSDNAHSTFQLVSKSSGSGSSSSDQRIPRALPLRPKASFKSREPPDMRAKPTPRVPPKLPPYKPPPKPIYPLSFLFPLTGQTESQDENCFPGSSSAEYTKNTKRMEVKAKSETDMLASTTQIPVYRYSNDDTSSETLHTPPPEVFKKSSAMKASTQQQKLPPKVPPKLLSKQPPKLPPKVFSTGFSPSVFTSPINPQGQFAAGSGIAPDSKEVLRKTSKTSESSFQGQPSPDFQASTRSNSGDEGYLKAIYPFKQRMLAKMASKPLPNLPPVPMRDKLPAVATDLACPRSSLALLASPTRSQDDFLLGVYQEPFVPAPTLRPQPLSSSTTSKLQQVNTFHGYKNVGSSTNPNSGRVPHYMPLLTYLPGDDDEPSDEEYIDMQSHT